MMNKKDCLFCHGKADLNDPSNSDFRVVVDTRDPGWPTISVGHYEGDWDDTRVINFCPICGRKLMD